VSLIFGIFGSICGPMKKCHVAVRTDVAGMVMWQDDVAGGWCVGGWRGPMVGCHVAQSWAAMWQWENAQ
jgi:hypothetical protein